MQTYYLLMPSGWEIFVILLVILLLFGGKKIPELMRGIGKGIREFNSARSSIENEIKEGMKEADKKTLEEKKDASAQAQ
jgi:sec-independent protein translocase protein TatA